jgi:hypothetical protein
MSSAAADDPPPEEQPLPRKRGAHKRVRHAIPISNDLLIPKLTQRAIRVQMR